MRTAKRILAEFMTVVMVLQACSPTVAAVAAGWQNISSEIATAAAEASDAAESGETKSDVTTGSGSSDTGAAGGSAEDDAAKDDTAAGDTSDSAAGSDPAGDQTEGEDAAEDAAADDAEQDADTEASEDAAAQADATITNLDDLVERLKDNGASDIVRKEDNSGIKSLVVNASTAFAVLSNANAQFYHDAQIGINFTGDLPDLTSKAENNTLSFQGLGSDACPFDGKIYDATASSGDDSVKLKTDRTVFNNLKLTNQNNTVKIKWVGATNYSAPMVASKVSGAENSEESKTLIASVDIADPVNADVKDKTSALTAPLLGTTTGNLTANVTYSLTASRKNLNANATGNIGLIGNTVESGTLTVESVTFPNDLASGGTVKTSSGNAGLLVGEVKDGATLSIGALTNVPTTTVQSTNGSAGGVVGLVGSSTGGVVNVTQALDLHSLTVKGTTASGGLIGKATKLTLGADNKKFTCPTNVGDADSQSSGGFIGEVSFASSVEFTNNDQIDTGNGVTLSGKANDDYGVGAVFGKLSFIDGVPNVSFVGGEFKSSYSANGGEAVFGGLVGNVTGETGSKKGKRAPSTLKVEGLTTKFSLEAKTRSAGGIAGWVGCNESATLEIKKANVYYSKMATPGHGFGGVVGCLDNYSLIDVNGLTVQNADVNNENVINAGAGIAAECWDAAIRLGGETDFSNMSFAKNGNVAQIALVRANRPTLVFARGTGKDVDKTSDDSGNYWVYKRCPAVEIDDLGGAKETAYGYGEVIRLDNDKLPKNLIQINASTHKLEGPSTSNLDWQLGYDTGKGWSDNNRTLNIRSTKDFVCLALTVQFPSLWIGVYGFGGNDGSALLGSDVIINLEGNIDLSGTGVMGIGFDSAKKPQTFQGTFNGNKKTIVLAIGEPYGMRGNGPIGSGDTTPGNGKIYRRGRLGLFSAIGGGATANGPTATVNNLTIDGVMNFDNGLAVDAGSLAATVTGNAALSGVTCEPAVTCADTFGNYANIGGIAGSVSGAGTVELANNAQAKALISTGKILKGNTSIGGAIGYVGDAAVTVNASGLTVGGSIVAGESASSKKIAQVGGLIGSIAQGAQTNVQKQINVAIVNITGLAFDSFAMTVGKNGDPKNGAGGLLGYSWGNADVTIGDGSIDANTNSYALKTTNASINAKDSKELGGLAYAASGHWIINDHAIDLSGATINAPAATMIGLLVGRGSKVAAGAYGSEPYAGLYLEDKAYWGTAYRVSGITIVAPEKLDFDEWVGNGTKPGSKLMDGDWNTVVSLHTQADTLDMSGNKGSDNSYKNRSTFGQSHNTNSNTRYYYNLDRAYAEAERANAVKNKLIDTAEELLLWSAYCYASNEVRPMIVPSNMKDWIGGAITIGGNSACTIDLQGYSYYPSQPGGKVTVKNATITFCYSKIKAEQNGNKLNSAATQHENMHCGLFRTVANGDLVVNSVTLSGTVGSVVNDGASSNDAAGAGGSASGALVCRYVYGSRKSDGTSAVRKITIDELTLNGLTIDGVDSNTDYAPLLINEMQTYVKLDAKNIKTTDCSEYVKTKAATSLFGKLGVGDGTNKDPNKAADQVTATFSQISVPSATDSSIFTHAVLLESFGYADGKTGSAVYTFTKQEETNKLVTYGKEIDSDGEYHGRQLWYYDENLNGQSDGLVTDGTVTANKDTPQFGGYLPYVKTGQTAVADKKIQYHEIKVNQRVPNLETGCGTYGDPYAITKATELNTVAEYINTQNPSDGWEVTIAVNQETLCQRRSSSNNADNEVTYVYNLAKKTWEKKTDPKDTLDDTTMHRYLQSAYYSIEPVDSNGNSIDTLVLDTTAFQGLGNQPNPFRGVIVGNLRSSSQSTSRATIKINNSKDSGALSGLIPYSYGSVVSNLNIEYSGKAASIAYKNKDTLSGVPGAFFGGVIGCVMGGDNIIDGVYVSASGDFSVAGDSHLVPVGGYVGAIAGGGVIFRNSLGGGDAPNDWHWHGAGASLYDNPFVGRVIDGYAFSELAPGKSLNNTDRNYKVNNLVNNPDTSNEKCIVTDETQGRYRGDDTNSLAITTTVNNSQGLLVLSAIISSGAAGGSANTAAANDAYGTYAGSRAYLGGNTSKNTKYQFGNQNYGKVRNASYGAVGQPANAETDFPIAIRDDRLSPGDQAEGNALDHNDATQMNSPYLVSKYATWQTGNICAAQASGIDLRFVNKDDDDIDYDMTPYGTGYTGLSGRYYSNACASDKGADRDRIVPLVATINGDGATVRVGSKASQTAYDIKEYIDDDYRLTGVGALFGTVTYTSANVSGSIVAPATGDTAATGNSGYTVRNLKFDDCNVSLRYVSFSAAATGDKNAPSNPPSSASEVGVGLLAGTTANASSLRGFGKYNTVTMTNSKVEGPNNVGGLLGASGYGSRRTDTSATWMVNTNDTANNDNRCSPVRLYDCSYSGMTVLGIQNVGGFVGKLNAGSQGGIWTTSNMDIAKDSTISSTGSSARTGGVLGVNGDLFCVNVDPDSNDKEVNANGIATIKNVSITAASSVGVGGLIGKVENSVYAHGLSVLGSGSSGSRASFGANTLQSIGGIAGFVTGGEVFKFDACKVMNIDLKSSGCSGGIIGQLQVASKRLVCNEIELRGLAFNGSYSGGIFGNLQYQIGSPSSIEVTNSVIAENAFSGDWSGGISGDGKGKFSLVNVLIDGNAFNKVNRQGVLFGAAVASNMYELYAAGLDVKPGDSKKNKDLPVLLQTNGVDVKDVNKKSYIAFGDYEDTLSVDKDATLYGNDVATGNVTAAVSPYVTTSPKSGLAVRTSDIDITDRYLFGDGMNVNLAATIQSPEDIDVANRYIYTNIGGIDDKGAYQNTSTYDAGSVKSTFNANNVAIGDQVATDFPVLVISGTDNTTVKSYLNIITNGGFSDACRLNGEDGTNPHVTAKAEVFQLKNGVFVKDEEASNNPTLRVVNNGKKNMSFSPSSDWDNGKGRFTLLTVTFTEAGQSYNVQVPIIVKRKLEIDFSATYDYGTNFKESNYANLGDGAHVLTSFGEPMTGLLTWTYNSANGTEVDFGWDSYMAAGGSMKGLGKSICFEEGSRGTLPQGTQLTLVDANVDGAAGGREYHYEVGEGGATSVSLSGNDGFKDSSKQAYQERWLSEILGVSAKQDNDGTWAVCDSEADATAKAKLGDTWTLFKVAGADVSANKRYTLKVPKDNEGKEQRASESVYLVVNVPKPSVDGTRANINGFTGTSIDSGSSGSRISWSLHHVLRTNGHNDSHNNTASTYGILSNYGQEVNDGKSEARTPVSKSTDGAAYVLSLDVTDKITFNPSQNYADSDSLFYQLDTSLCKYGTNNNLTGVSSFPSGTSAIAKFYVAIGDQNYRWNGNDWETCDASTPAFTQTVMDTGNDSLKLMLDHDLAGIRKRATGGSFTVRTVVEEIRLTPDGCNKVIALSQQSGEDAYTKMSYTAKLSTRKEGLDTSSLTQTKRGYVGYYRMDKGDATITLSAPEKSQLGINVDDLRPIANGTIGLGATYELGGLNNATEAIKNADSVVYTLTLRRRSGIDGSYEDVTDGISNYVTVTESKLATVSDTGNAITFTDTKKDGAFGTKNGDTTFNLPFTVKVNTQVEQSEQFYANYRLVMTASLVTGVAMSAMPQSPDYVTYTLTRVNLNGIDH